LARVVIGRARRALLAAGRKDKFMGLRSLSACFVLCVASGAALAADPVGSYAVKGDNPGHHGSYAGTVEVAKTGDTYSVLWSIAGTKYVGTGIGNDKFLAVSYKSGDSTGLALYAEKGDDWIGFWTYAGGTTLGGEQWTRQ
jgi:hypothetical protein